MASAYCAVTTGQPRNTASPMRLGAGCCPTPGRTGARPRDRRSTLAALVARRRGDGNDDGASPTLPWNRRVAPSSSTKSLAKASSPSPPPRSAGPPGGCRPPPPGRRRLERIGGKADASAAGLDHARGDDLAGHQVHGRRADEGGDEARRRQAIDLRSARRSARCGRRSSPPPVSASVMASTWSWVTKIEVALRRLCRRRISVRICTRSLASRLDSGSSNRNACGSRTMARPMATRWRWPPDSARGLRFEEVADGQQLGGLGDAPLDLGLGHAAVAQAVGHVVVDATCADRARSSGTPWRCRGRRAPPR